VGVGGGTVKKKSSQPLERTSAGLGEKPPTSRGMVLKIRADQRKTWKMFQTGGDPKNKTKVCGGGGGGETGVSVKGY